MADSWEDEDFEPEAPVVPKPPVKGAWDDEEEEEEEAKETSTEAEKKTPAASKPKKEKKPKAAAAQDETLADPVAEKLRQQRLVEESDFKATKELFGGDKEERSLEGFIPKTEADYLEYATLIAEKVTPFQKSFHYLTMLKHLAKAVSEPLKSADVKELASVLTVLANEKLKAEKAAETGGKKSKAAKAKRELKVDAAEDDFRNVGYDGPDDYDFM